MAILNKVYLVTILLLFTACQPTVEEDNTQDLDKEKSTHKTENNSLQHINNCYHHLRGTLGDMLIIAELIEDDNEDESEGGLLNGYYLYEQYGGPIALYGNFDKQGKIELTEQGSWDGEPHKIIGKWETSGSFKGEWISGNNKDRFPIILTSSSNDFIKLNCHQIEDSLTAFPKKKFSPLATFSAHWFEAQSDNKTLNAFLNKAIKKAISGGDWSYSKKKGNDFIQNQKKAYFDEYKNEITLGIKDGMIDTTTTEEEFFGLNYALDISMEVYYNSPKLLTLGYTYYTYTGGAHGMYGTTVASYDLEHFKEVKLDDLFIKGYENAVSKQLDNAIRLKFKLGEEVSLSEILFEDAIVPNDNFGITEKGVFFVYTPYEIAPYAAGEIELFVAFEKIQDWLK